MIAEIANTDAMTYMEMLSDDSIDLIVCDPDYNDYSFLLKNGLIESFMRILKPSGNLICFTKQPFDYELRCKIDPYFRREIIWSFTNGGAWVSNKMPLVSFQKLYWCVKSKDFYFNPRTGVEYSENTKNFKRSSKVFGGWKSEGRCFQKNSDGIWLRDHLHFNKPMAGEIPAKPRELINILIKCFCPKMGTVYDPFSGSGIVTKVADENECEVYATEIKTERCDHIINMFQEDDENIEGQMSWKEVANYDTE